MTGSSYPPRALYIRNVVLHLLSLSPLRDATHPLQSVRFLEVRLKVVTVATVAGDHLPPLAALGVGKFLVFIAFRRIDKQSFMNDLSQARSLTKSPGTLKSSTVLATSAPRAHVMQPPFLSRDRRRCRYWHDWITISRVNYL